MTARGLEVAVASPTFWNTPKMSHASEDSGAKCPIDHASREKWAKMQQPPGPSSASGNLSVDRETSSIPRADGERWVYPSQAQFFDAMARKNHSPRADDMKVIVPIHNAVNERAWAEVLKWERSKGGDKCGGIKLVSFKGDASKLSPKARFKMLLGCVVSSSDVLRALIEIGYSDIRHHLIGTTGTSIGVAFACGTSSTFIPDVQILQTRHQQETHRSTSTCGQRWTTSKVLL